MTLKTLPSKPRRLLVFVLLMVIHLAAIDTAAQIPDCFSNQYMYGVFAIIASPDSFPPAGTDSTEIREISFATGTIGPLMGGRRYYIRRNPGGGTSSGSYYYGSAAMALDHVSGRFYLITQMGGSGNKDIIMIDPAAPTATGTVIRTMGNASSVEVSNENMGGYHFVKAAISPGFPRYGYTIGVSSSTSTSSSVYNPLIRFDVCNTDDCADGNGTIYLGNLPDDGVMFKQGLYNGDIAFDNDGNLYFFASAYGQVSGSGRYTDSRLFRINAADVPTSADPNHTIPMQFVADFDDMDSTGASGLAFDAGGNMYMTTKRYLDNSNLGAGSYNEMYASYDTSTTLMMPYTPPEPYLSLNDLASCYFPNAILFDPKLALTATFHGGQVRLQWKVTNNNDVEKYEVQRSDDGIEFNTIATIYPGPGFTYTYEDPQTGYDKYKYYRVRQVKASGIRYYTNKCKVLLNSNIALTSRVMPNPFKDNLNFSVDVKSPATVQVRIVDQSGRLVSTRQFNCSQGYNKLSVTGLGNLISGIYVAEIILGEEVIRSKIIKQ